MRQKVSRLPSRTSFRSIGWDIAPEGRETPAQGGWSSTFKDGKEVNHVEGAESQ